MDGFSNMISKALEEYDVEIQKNYKVPGFFRTSKKWDLVVLKDDVVLAAIEYKSQIGESTKKNFNNRIEEAVGNAHDFKMAERKQLIPTCKKAWLGYLFVLENIPGVMKCHKTKPSIFERYLNSFTKLEGTLYDKACLLLTDRETGFVSYGQTPLKSFLELLEAHIHRNV